MRVTAAGTRSVRPGTGAAGRRRARSARTLRLRSSEIHAERPVSGAGEARMPERPGCSFDFNHDDVRHPER